MAFDHLSDPQALDDVGADAKDADHETAGFAETGPLSWGTTSDETGGGEDDASALVALNDGIVLGTGGASQTLLTAGSALSPELHHKAGNDAKEGRVGEVAIADQVVEAVCAEGRPVAMDFDGDEITRSGRGSRLEDRGRLGGEGRRVQQGGTRAGSGGGMGGTGGLRGALCRGRLGAGVWAWTTDEKPRQPGALARLIWTNYLSVAEAAKAMRVTRQQLHNVLQGRSAVTPQMALRFEKAFGGSADMWLRMQAAYDLPRRVSSKGK